MGCSTHFKPESEEAEEKSRSNGVELITQTSEQVALKSEGCMSCHTEVDSPSMHKSPAVHLGCTDCHGGKADVFVSEGSEIGSDTYEEAKNGAHVLPKYPEVWKTSANPKRTYTYLLKESPEFVKFFNPGDLRVAEETCGGCHLEEVRNVRKSLMTTSAVFWAAAAYNNGILAQKSAMFGEGYNRDGKPVTIQSVPPPTEEQMSTKGEVPVIMPLPRWEIMPPADNFRVFEDGGLLNITIFPDIGNPNPIAEGGKPDTRQSIRDLGTGLRISVPVLNLHKTRLNDPHLSLLGTNDQPGDYRSSGCSGCHVIYANDRDPFNSGPYAKYGNLGKTQTSDPTIPKDESAHPLKHEFTSAIPTSQCMVCHMHQPNVFLNSFLGYTMWDYETEGEFMWPKEQRYPTDTEMWEVLSRNPEEAAVRGLWSDVKFLANVWDLNPKLKHTQFADYHGHGWNFRAVFKRDREGNLLDVEDNIIPFEEITPDKLQRAVKETTENPENRLGIPVHLKDIHLEKGMHCVDCHFEQDNHGNGQLHGEYANAIEIGCIDCHGTIWEKTTLKTSGVAAPEGGHDFSRLRTPSGRKRFVCKGDKLYQRAMVDPELEWEVVQVVDSINPASHNYNEKSRLAKTIRKDGKTWGNTLPPGHGEMLAHSDDNMECYTCHSSWTTACAGCHLPIQANWKVKMKHFEGLENRNWATYNPQAVRTDQYILGINGTTSGNKIAPIRSSSALVLSSTNLNRERIYIQQPPISSPGYSSQAFNPHFPHTVRSHETKMCTDCHISEKNDNNAWMQSLLGQGTNFVNFIGRNAWVALGKGGLEAVNVTEWDEPQAVIGSTFHKLAYPDYYAKHKARGDDLESAYHHGGRNVQDIQLRGEYLYTADGSGGLMVFDVANIDNKGFSERIVTAPVSPLGQRTYVRTKYATAVGLPTTMPVDPTRCYREERGGKPFKPEEPLPLEPCRPENQEQRLQELYRYAFVTDKFEGLVVVNVDTLADRDPKNNFIKRMATFNPDGILNGANDIEIAGNYAYITADKGLIVVNIAKPLEPRLVAIVGSPFIVNPKAVAVQFRYAFAIDDEGLKVIDITDPENPHPVKEATLSLEESNDIYVARTYAFIAGGKDGFIIVDIEKPEKPEIYQTYNADGKINDTRGVKVGTTNASFFAYLADGKNGLRVVQLTSPEMTPGYYGFNPPLAPELIATYHTHSPALAVSKGLDRDRAVDESGNQVSIFGRIGSRPFNLEEMKKLYLMNGKVYKVTDEPPSNPLPFRMEGNNKK
ncbi:hypothetical protein MYX76_11840 [Desulfobacterota bacterium AH_259_B03_O07]|nr:hypothetical protein [Desulfobacterota bacterium AH_259_B03_O07]